MSNPSTSSRRVADLDLRVGGILEGVADDPVVPRGIRELDRVRAATIAVLEAELIAPDEARLLERLLGVARKCELPWLAAGAILEEIRPTKPRPVDARRYVIRARQLRRAGYVKCPACALDVLDDVTLERLERADREWLKGIDLVADRRQRLKGDAAWAR